MNMETRKEQLLIFFRRYSDKFNEALIGVMDIEAITKSFSSCFVSANPSGVFCGSNDTHFATAISQGYAFYQGIGFTAMNIISCETTILDEFHEMNRIRWRCSFTRKDQSSGSIVFDNIYFTQTIKNDPKIFAYITGNEQAALKENGLI